MSRNLIQRFGADILRAVRRENFERTVDGGVLVFGGSLRFDNHYVEGIKGLPASFRRHKNLVPDAGILHILDVVLGGTAKNAAWYIAPYGNNATPAANWTAANFAANSGEINSGTEGYVESTRQQFVPASAAAGKITNAASMAAFTINCTTTLNIYGAGLLSVNTRAGTTGVLISAVKFGTVRIANDDDTWLCGYEVSASDS
jgi:hypothetical protein